MSDDRDYISELDIAESARQRWLDTHIAIDRVVAFERFGPAHLALAHRAALPSLLTPELVNLIRVNFLPEQTPWIAEMDLLLSNLCMPRGHGFYEVEPRVREVLLADPKNTSSWQDMLNIAQFLYIYAVHKERQLPPNIYEMYIRIAQAYRQPHKLIETAREVLRRSVEEGTNLARVADQIQIIDTMELVREPLQQFTFPGEVEELYLSTRILAYYFYGDEQKLLEHLQTRAASESSTRAPLLASVVDRIKADLLQRDNEPALDVNEGEVAEQPIEPLSTQLAFPEENIEQLIDNNPEEKLAAILAITDEALRTRALLDLLPELSGVRQAEVIREMLKTPHFPDDNGDTIRNFITYLPNLPDVSRSEIIEQVLQVVSAIEDDDVRKAILDSLLDNALESTAAQVEVLDAFIRYIPGIWKAELAKQTLTIAKRKIENRELRIQVLSKLLSYAPENLKAEINRELQLAQSIDHDDPPPPTLVTKSKRADPPPESRSPLISVVSSVMEEMDLAVRCICPSCFTDIHLARCKIVSGKTGKVLKDSRKGFLTDLWSVEPLTGPRYTLELAQRQCYICDYLLPPNIERVPSIVLAVAGDPFSGKSLYIAGLIHQLKTLWTSSSTGFTRFNCLTEKVEAKYTRDYFEPLFTHKRILMPTQSATGPYADPLIYETITSSRSKHKKTVANLVIYDAAGEDFEDQSRLVNYARFALTASAFIFVADPFTMQSFIKRLSYPIKDVVQGRRAAERFTAVLSMYKRFQGKAEGDSLPSLPIAIMVSKSDLFKASNQPHKYTFMTNPDYTHGMDLGDMNTVDREVRGLLHEYQQDDLIEAASQYKRVKFFATSATGEPPDADGNLAHVEPCRCLDPVLWILDQFEGLRAGLIVK